MRRIIQGLAIAPVMFCLCGAFVISRPAAAQEMKVEPRKAMPEKTEELRPLKEEEPAVSDEKIEEKVKAAKDAWDRQPQAPRRANGVSGKFIPEHQPEEGKIELHTHDNCEVWYHDPTMVDKCKKRRERAILGRHYLK